MTDIFCTLDPSNGSALETGRFWWQRRLRGLVVARPAGGLATVPSGDVSDRKRFVAVAEACLERARADESGGVCSTWQ